MTPRERTAGGGRWRFGRQHPAALAALVVSGVLVLLALCAPLLVTIWGHGPLEQYKRAGGLTPRGLPVGPRAAFWLGSDQQGRDVLSRLLYGARVSLFVGVVATLVATVVGTALGLAAGYFGGWVDAAASRFMDAVLSMPNLLLAIALVAVVGPGLGVTIAVLAFFSWAAIGRLVRGLTRSEREKEYVEAAKKAAKAASVQSPSHKAQIKPASPPIPVSVAPLPKDARTLRSLQDVIPEWLWPSPHAPQLA